MESEEKSVQAEFAVASRASLVKKLDPSLMILSASMLLAALIISGALLYVNQGKSVPTGNENVRQTPAPVKVDVSLGVAPLLGAADAKVTLIEFSDFQCPYCLRFWKDTYPQIKKEYIDTGKVKFAFRHYPLPSHPMAAPAALASLCANEQGKFWQMHDAIFSNQAAGSQLDAKNIKVWAFAIGLNAASFNQCLDSSKFSEDVQKDITDGNAAGVNGTPSFFINGKLLVGALPFADFKKALDDELSAVGGLKIPFLK